MMKRTGIKAGAAGAVTAALLGGGLLTAPSADASVYYGPMTEWECNHQIAAVPGARIEQGCHMVWAPEGQALGWYWIARF